MDAQWLAWARKIQAIAQTGIAFTKDVFDKQRFENLLQIVDEILLAKAPADAPAVSEILHGQRGYATPKMDLRGAAFRDGKVLLVKEHSDGLWTLPGGWADINESPAECVVKEIFEESGFQARAVKLLGVLDKRKHNHPPEFFHSYKFFFLCEIIGGKATPSVETDEVAFFSRHEIPSLSLPRVTPAQIERLFDHTAHPEWPTDFD